jgi:hypothetical protein
VRGKRAYFVEVFTSVGVNYSLFKGKVADKRAKLRAIKLVRWLFEILLQLINFDRCDPI